MKFPSLLYYCLPLIPLLYGSTAAQTLPGEKSGSSAENRTEEKTLTAPAWIDKLEPKFLPEFITIQGCAINEEGNAIAGYQFDLVLDGVKTMQSGTDEYGGYRLDITIKKMPKPKLKKLLSGEFELLFYEYGKLFHIEKRSVPLPEPILVKGEYVFEGGNRNGCRE